MPRLAPGHEVGVGLDALLAVVGTGAGGVDEGDGELAGEVELGASGWGCSLGHGGIVPARRELSRDEAVELVGLDWVNLAERQHQAMIEDLEWALAD